MTAGGGQIRCDGCGSELKPEAKFCRSCGRSTSAAVDSPSPGGAAAPTPASSQEVESSPAAETTKLIAVGTSVGERASPSASPAPSTSTSIESAGRYSNLKSAKWVVVGGVFAVAIIVGIVDPSTFEVFSNECNRFLFFTLEHNWRFRYESSAHDNLNNCLIIDLDYNYYRIRQCGGREDQLPPCSELKRPQCNRQRRQMTSRTAGTSAKTSPRSTAPPSPDSCS